MRNNGDSRGRLVQRIGLAGPRHELRELGDAVDDLLGRLEASFRAQRQFIANASHELRTPLARQRTVLEVALRVPTDAKLPPPPAHSPALPGLVCLSRCGYRVALTHLFVSLDTPLPFRDDRQRSG